MPMIHDICMARPASGRKVDCYFTTGHIKRFDAGGRNDRKCVDIDPETIYEEGVTVKSPY